MRSWWSPTSLLWLGVHLILVLGGVLCMTAEGERIFGATLAQSVGSSLIATGIAGMVLYLYVKRLERGSDHSRGCPQQQESQQQA
jgi:hypothetical protein